MTDVVRIAPEVTGQIGGFKMYALSGADQIARDVSAKGWNGFEAPMPSVFAACVAESHGLVLDVGANTGFYSLLAARSSRHVEIHAFEPLPAVRERLRANLELNGLRERVAVFAEAVSDEVGAVRLYVPPQGHGLVETSASLDSGFKEAIESVVAVSSTTLDDHLSVSRQAEVDVVKIDVEGAEHRVLAGARHVLAVGRPKVFLEVLPRADVGALDAIRSDHRYTVVLLRASTAIIADRVEFDEQGWNQLLVPTEQLGSTLSTLEGLGLSVTS